MKPATTWILVADGAQARVFEQVSSGPQIRELESLALSGSRKAASEIMSDRPGRTFDSVGEGRHAMAYTTDPQKLEERHFIESVAKMLQNHVDEYKHLRLVAAPAALGDLRQCLTEPVARKLVDEFDLDLTNLPAKDLVARLLRL